MGVFVNVFILAINNNLIDESNDKEWKDLFKCIDLYYLDNIRDGVYL